MIRRVSFLILFLVFLSGVLEAGTITLPRTGQTSPSTAGYDGNIKAGVDWTSATRLTANADTSLTDNLTGLIWASNGNLMPTRDPGWDPDGPDDGIVKWQNALNYVSKLNTENYLGHNDWRLPNINELESLIDFKTCELVTGFASAIPPYWSSTTTPDNAGYVYTVLANDTYSNNCSISADEKITANLYRVLPVRGGQSDFVDTNYPSNIWKTGQTTSYDSSPNKTDDGALKKGVEWPSPRFVSADASGNIILDNLTGLMWTKDAGTPAVTTGSCTGGTKKWAAAVDYVNCLNTAKHLGHSDWRVPNRRELRSLVNYGERYNNTWLINNGFSNVKTSYYWTSTVDPNISGYMWVMAFNYDGTGNRLSYFYPYSEQSSIYATYTWPVRGGYPNTLSADASYNYGSVHVDASASKTFTITNSGVVEVNVRDASTGNAENVEFFTTNNCSSPNYSSALAPKATCTVSVRFAPKTSGPKSATLSIISDAADTPIVSIALSGTGVSTLNVSINPPTNPFDASGAGSVTGVGINCPGDCSENYSIYKPSAQLTATGYTGYHWGSWTGVGDASGNPVIIDTSTNKSVIANFEINQYTVTTDVSGTVSVGQTVTLANNTVGINCTWDGTKGGKCTSDSLIYGTRVVLTATLPAGTTINWVSVCDSSTTTPLTATCTINSLTADKVIHPITTAETHTVTVNPSGGVSTGQTVVFTSTPGGVNCTWNGTASGGTCLSGNLIYGTQVVLTATKIPGTTITWSSGCDASGDTTTTTTCTITSLTADRTVVPTMVVQTFTISSSVPGGHGTVSCSSPVNYGAPATCVINASANYHIATLKDNNASVFSLISGNNYTISNITNNHDIVASFEINRYQLTVNKIGSGTGTVTSAPTGINCGATCTATYDASTSVTLTATADASANFSRWGGACSGTEPTCTITMDAPKNVIATFSVATPQTTVKLPKTGQTTKYVSGDDGDLQKGVTWPSPRFIEVGDCVTDRLTGLIWAKNGNTPNGVKSWQGSLDYVATTINSGAGLCDYKDWRLPNLNELASLLNADASINATWLNAQGFTNIQSNYYWSSTSFDDGNAWDIGFGDGVYTYVNKSSFHYVLPVRTGSGQLVPAISLPRTGQTTSFATGDDGALQKGIQWAEPRFATTDASGDNVLDEFTGLIWSKKADTSGNLHCSGGKKTWEQALNYVTCLNGANAYGHNDWRLPNINELKSLLNADTSQNAIMLNLQGFSNVKDDEHYWTATTYAADASQAWYVYMSNGNVSHNVKTSNYYVWPVREVKVPSANLTYNNLFVSIGSIPDSRAGNDLYYTSDSLDVNYDIESIGAVLEPFTAKIYVDGIELSSWQMQFAGPNYFQVGGYKIGHLSAGKHTILMAIDTSGSVAETDETDNETSIEITVLNPVLHLSPGWNFISLPLQPDNTAIGKILNDVSHVRVVWGYDNQNKQWIKYNPSAVVNTLSTMSMNGYWIYMDSSADFELTGDNTEYSVILHEGWNLVGFNGNNGQLPGALYMSNSGLSDKWAALWNWHNGKWTVKLSDTTIQPPVEPLTNLYRTRAYWIRVKPGSGTVNWAQ